MAPIIDTKTLFNTDHLTTDLKKRSLQGGAITLSTQAASFAIRIVSTMILARILTPQDYGLIAMVVAITGFAKMFSDLGLSTAIIQKDEFTNEQADTLFWINTGVGAAITIAILSSSPIVAWFYGEPQLLWITVVLSLDFIINGLAVQHRALLTRQMRFSTIAKVDVLSTLLAFVVAIIMALYGFRYWALVSNIIVSSLLATSFFWLASKWVPGLPKRNSGVSPMLRFGSDIACYNLMNYFSRNLDNILIGHYHGSTALGFYSKAYQLLMMPITNLRQPMNKVTMPVLSRLQDNPQRFKNYYVKYLSILSFVSMPLVAFLFVCSDDIVNLFLGSQWTEASGIFKILALVALIQPVETSRGMILVSLGKSRKYLFLGAASSFIFALSFLIGVSWGAKGVAVAYAVATYATFVPFLFLSFKDTPITVHHFFDAIKKPLLASLFMGLACHFLLLEIQDLNSICSLAICLVAGFLTYLASITLLSRGLSDLRSFADYIKLIFSRT